MEELSHDTPWQELARELHEVITLLPHFDRHKDRDVSAHTLLQGLRDYQFSEDEGPAHVRIRVQNFTRRELHLFALVFHQWQRSFGTSHPDSII